MRPQELIDRYGLRDIRIYAEDGHVQIAGRRSALTQADCVIIRQHQAALIAYLLDTGKAKTAKVKAKPDLPDLAGPMLKRFGYQVDLIQDEDNARRVVEEITAAKHPLIGIDCETAPLPDFKGHSDAGLDPHRSYPRLAQVAVPGTVHVFDLAMLNIQLLQPLLLGTWTAHNSKFEWKVFKTARLDPGTPHCSMLLYRTAYGATYGKGLLEVAHRLFKLFPDRETEVCWTKWKSQLQKSDWTAPDLSQIQLRYASLDAALTLEISRAASKKLHETRQTASYQLFRRLIPVIGQQELTGLHFDQAAHATITAQVNSEKSALEETLATLIGADPSKPDNVRAWLHSILSSEELAAWPRTAKDHKLSLTAAVIAESSIPHRDLLARYYKLKKLTEAFGENYSAHVNAVTGKIHPTYSIGGAASGRFTCSKPNLQQIPGRPSKLEGVPGGETYRKLITAAPGRLLVVGDLSQIEIRVAAQISCCPVLLDALRTGKDIHRMNAAVALGIDQAAVTKAQRQSAKAISFGLIFGGGAARIQQIMQDEYHQAVSIEDAEKIMKAILAQFTGYNRWRNQVIQRGNQGDVIAHTPGGLQRVCKKNGQFYAPYALNHPVQGGAFEVLAHALILLPERLQGLDAHLLATVHDEVVVEASETDAEAAKDRLTTALIDAYLMVFPGGVAEGLVEPHIGKTWFDAK